jgi:hypothetical protein
MTIARISTAELNRKLADLSIPDSELARYFVTDDAQSGEGPPEFRLPRVT